MKYSYKSMMAAAALLTLATPAMASGGLWCTIDDASLRMKVESGVTRGMGGPLFNFHASAELLDPAVATDFRNITLDDKLVHSWLEGGDTRLLFYAERASDKTHGYVSITIKTLGNPEEEVDAKGTYELTYFEADRQQGDDTGYRTFKGEASCGGE